MKITHVFPGYLHFHVLEMIKTVVLNSKHDAKFVIYYTTEEQVIMYQELFKTLHIAANNVLFLKFGHQSYIKNIVVFLRMLFFSSLRIIVHCDQWKIYQLFIGRCFLKRIVWVCWGDIPSFLQELPAWKKTYWTVKIILRNRLHNGIVTLMTSDKEALEKLGGKSKKIIVHSYPPRDYEYFCQLEQKKHERFCLILGNSASQIRYYSQILDRVDPCDWDEIICMMNYGHENKPEEVVSFIEKYKDIFGPKFFAWRQIVSYMEYLSVLSRGSVYVSPTPRQIGLGAIYPLLIMGARVYVHGANYQWLKRLGCVIFDTDEKISRDPLDSEQAKKNKSIILNLLNPDLCHTRWDEIYTLAAFGNE